MEGEELVKKAKDMGINDKFERVRVGWISQAPETDSNDEKLVGQAHYVIVDGEDKVRIFASGVPPTRIKEALEILSRSSAYLPK
jgi:hypothetical protein